MLTCRHFVAGLSEYLDDAQDAATRRRFDMHLESCPRCRIVCDTTRKTVDLYRMLQPAAVSPALESRLMEAIRSRVPVRR